MALPDMGKFQVEMLPEVSAWARTLDPKHQTRFAALTAKLEEHGPALRGPTVRPIKGGREHKLKELRLNNHSLRVLFSVEDGKKAVMLVGGDKEHNWKGWYPPNISLAEQRLADWRRNNGRGGDGWTDRGGPGRGPKGPER